jgi:hypothetical protein
MIGRFHCTVHADISQTFLPVEKPIMSLLAAVDCQAKRP